MARTTQASRTPDSMADFRHQEGLHFLLSAGPLGLAFHIVFDLFISVFISFNEDKAFCSPIHYIEVRFHCLLREKIVMFKKR